MLRWDMSCLFFLSSVKKPLRVYCILVRFASLFSLEFECSTVPGVTMLAVILLLEPSLRSGVFSISVDFLAVLLVFGGGSEVDIR